MSADEAARSKVRGERQAEQGKSRGVSEQEVGWQCLLEREAYGAGVKVNSTQQCGSSVWLKAVLKAARRRDRQPVFGL